MSVISILRDTPNNVSIVRMISTNTIAEVSAAGYIPSQMDNIKALNSGFWQWYVTDFIVCSCSDGNAIFTFTNSTFSRLQIYGGSGGPFLPLAGGNMSGAITSDADVFMQLRTGFLYFNLGVSGNLSPVDSNFCFVFTVDSLDFADDAGLSEYPNGFQFALKNVSAGDCTFTPKSGEFIDGHASLTIKSQEGYHIVKTATQWSTIASFSASDMTGVTPQQVQQNAFNVSSDSGTGAAYVGSLSPAPAAYTNGLTVWIKCDTTNTVVNPTLKLGALDAKQIYNGQGSILALGDMEIDKYTQLVFNTNLDGWQIQNPQNTLNAIQYQVTGRAMDATDTGVADAYVASNHFFPDSALTLSEGMMVNLVVANNNTGAATFAYMGAAPAAIVLADGSDISADMMVAGGTSLLTLRSGGKWQLMNPVSSGGGVTPAQIQANSLVVATDTGTSTNYVGTLTPALGAYTVGMQVYLIPANTNTDNAPNFRIDALANYPIVLNNLFDPIAIGDIQNSRIAVLELSVSGVWILLNPATFSQPNLIQNKYAAFHDYGSLNAYSSQSLIYPNVQQYPGQIVVLKDVNSTNTGAATMAFGAGATPRNIVVQGSSLVGGEMVLNGTAVLMLDSSGLTWELLNPQINNSGVTAAQVQNWGVNSGSAAGAANAYTLSLSPAPAALVNSLTVIMIPNNDNTSGSPTLDLNGLGAKTITRSDGSSLYNSDISAGYPTILTYLASVDNWILQTPTNLNAYAKPLQVQSNTFSGAITSGGTVAFTASLNPTLGAYVDRMVVVLRFNANNSTTTPTIDLGPGVKNIVRQGQSALAVNDIVAGTDAVLVYSSVNGNFELLNPQALGQIPGTATNDNAAAGNVGEYIPAEIDEASAVSLTNLTAANVTSISLTTGDWEVSGNVLFLPANTTQVTRMESGINTTSATLPPTFERGSTFGVTYTGNGTQSISIQPGNARRFSLSTTTTIYLVAYSEFSVSTNKAFGYLHARRVR